MSSGRVTTLNLNGNGLVNHLICHVITESRKIGKKFVFGSEIKSILEDKEIKRELNKDAMHEFLTFRYIHSEKTILNKIRRLKPGNMLVYDCKTNKLNKKEYWDVQISDKNSNPKACEKKILELFRDSVDKRLMSDVPLGVYLSGGIDSSSIVAMMKSLKVENINTYSVAFEHDEIGNELEHARKVSDMFGTKHHEFTIKSDIVKELPKIVWHLDEPLSDPAVVPVYYLSREASKSVTVILSGDGADELYAGYDQYKFLNLGNKIRHVPRIARKHVIPATTKIIPAAILNKIYKYSKSTGSKLHDRLSKFLANVNENKAKSYLEVISVFDEEEMQELLKEDNFNVGLMYEEINNNYKHICSLYVCVRSKFPCRFLGRFSKWIKICYRPWWCK